MRKWFFAVLVLSLLPAALMAQDRAEIFGGYQYLHTGNITINGQTDTNSSQGFNGWDTAVTGYVNRFVGVSGDFSGAYATIGGVSSHVYTYSGGPTVGVRVGAIKPFAHALFGGLSIGGSEGGISVSKTGFTVMAGGGVDARVVRGIAVRLIQVDWLYYHFGSSSAAGVEVPSFSQSNNVRIATGIVFRF